MQQELWGEIMVNTDLKTKLEASSSRIVEVDQEISTVKSKINDLNNKLNDGNLTSSENAENINLMKTYYSNELEKLAKVKDTYVKEIQDSINKADISSFLSDFIKNYQSFVDQLSLDQLVALFNIIGFGMLLSTLFSISTLLIGDYLIDKLQLDIKYPKISKYIKLKQRLNKHYLMFYMTMLFIISIVFILANVYMFLLKYFV